MIPYPFDSSEGNFKESDLLKEETNEDRYYALELTDEQSEVTEAYVHEYVTRLRKKDDAIKQLIEAMPEDMTYYKNKLHNIIKL